MVHTSSALSSSCVEGYATSLLIEIFLFTGCYRLLSMCTYYLRKKGFFHVEWQDWRIRSKMFRRNKSGDVLGWRFANCRRRKVALTLTVLSLSIQNKPWSKSLRVAEQDADITHQWRPVMCLCDFNHKINIDYTHFGFWSNVCMERRRFGWWRIARLRRIINDIFPFFCCE